MIITHKLTLALDSRQAMQSIDGVQGDTARAVELALTEGGKAWPVPEGTSVVIRYRRVRSGAGGIYDTMPDGTGAYSISENKVTVWLAPQVFAAAGPVELQLTLICQGAELTSFSILVYVQGNLGDAAEDDESYVNLSRQIETAVSAAVESAMPSGIHVGPEEPDEDNVELWVDTDDQSGSGGQSGSQTGGAEKWETIFDLTTTEEVEKIAITADEAGNAFCLSEVVVEVSVVSTESNSEEKPLQIRVNADSNAFGATNTAASRIFRSTGGPFSCAYRLHCRGQRVMGEIYNISNDTSGIKGYFSNHATDGVIAFYFAGGVFGVGSRIMVKGVRK